MHKIVYNQSVTKQFPEHPLWLDLLKIILPRLIICLFSKALNQDPWRDIAEINGILLFDSLFTVTYNQPFTLIPARTTFLAEKKKKEK